MAISTTCITCNSNHWDVHLSNIHHLQQQPLGWVISTTLITCNSNTWEIKIVRNCLVRAALLVDQFLYRLNEGWRTTFTNVCTQQFVLVHVYHKRDWSFQKKQETLPKLAIVFGTFLYIKVYNTFSLSLYIVCSTKLMVSLRWNLDCVNKGKPHYWLQAFIFFTISGQRLKCRLKKLLQFWWILRPN